MPLEKKKCATLALNSSAGSQEPIFNRAVKAGAAAEPNSRADDNSGNNCDKVEEKSSVTI